MRPIYLSVEGINSFSQKQEIDFSDFSASNIFCIYGTTGSGKTTLLDSIILALYGDGDRADTLSEYISLGKEKAEIVFRFLLEDTLYEVKKTITKKGVSKCVLTNLTRNVIEADRGENVNKKIIELIGLSRNEFTQVIILEQGKFNKFLTEDKAKRSRTISRLFGLDKYDSLSTRFNTLAKKYESLLNFTDEKLMYFADISPEKIMELTKNLAILKQEENKLKTSVDSVSKRLSEEAVNEVNYKSLINAKKSLNAANAVLKAKCDVLDSYANQLSALTLQENELVSAENQLNLAIKTLENLARVRRETESLNEKKNELKNIEKDLIKIDGDYIILQQNYKAANENAQAVESELNAALSQIEQDCNAKVFEENPDKTTTIQGFKNALVLNVDRMKNINGRYINLTGKLKELKLKQDELDKESGDTQIDLNALKMKESELKNNCDKIKKQLEDYNRLNVAFSISKSLTKGDLCPVCGGTFNGGIEQNGHTVSDIEGEAERVQSLFEDAAKARGQAEQRFIMLVALLQGTNREAEALEQEKTELNNSISLIKESNYSLSLSASEALLIKVLSAEEKALNLTSIIKQSEKLQSDMLTLEFSKKNLMQRSKDANAEIERWAKNNPGFVSVDLDAQEKISLEDKERSEKFIREYKSKKAALEKSLAETEADIKQLNSSINIYSGTILSLGDVKHDPEVVLNLEREKKEIDVLLSDCLKKYAKCESELKRAEDGKDEKERLIKERENCKKNLDLAAELYKLFKGNKFLEYIEEEYIQRFTSLASEKLFSLSGGKYSLEYKEDEKKSDFYVTDYLRGGEQRKVRTLSGGETFLASMSMAIAISSQISSTRQYDFFFLDEGFGTLDEDAIETVADALYNLSRTTFVGVVSHRSELVERIPQRIKVLPSTSESGSRIIIET